MDNITSQPNSTYTNEPLTERYELTWTGKSEAIALAHTPSEGVFVPMQQESVNRTSTNNLFIEGDNLEVLKLLQAEYFEAIKLIYIDPPYNTGKDFIYRDKFNTKYHAYLRRSGQIDADGNPRPDVEISGRRHANWLNMMVPRLTLAYPLLREDGMIIISIDDHEAHNLRLLMDEIFGAENFVTQFVWHSSTAGGLRSKHVNQNHEYALCYAKNITILPKLFAPLSPEAIRHYNKEDARGRYREKDFAWRAKVQNPRQCYLIDCPDGSQVQPPQGYLFRFKPERFQEALANDEVVFKQTKTSPLLDAEGKQAKWNIYIKKYLGDGMGAPASFLPKSLVGMSNVGTDELKALFGRKVFHNPKSTRYLTYYLQLGTESDSEDIVLDFFAGSGSTAHAVLALNHEDGGNRRFIMVQLAEETGDDEFETIAALGRERIRRVIAGLGNEDVGFQALHLQLDRETNQRPL